MWWVAEGASASLSGKTEMLDVVRRESSHTVVVDDPEGIANEIPFVGSRRMSKFIAQKIEVDCVYSNDTIPSILEPRWGFVGKSLGAVRLVRAFKRLAKRRSWWAEYKDRVARSVVILVDPYAPFSPPLDGHHMPEKTTCVYQRESWPEGMTVDGVVNLRIANCDHFSIINSFAVANIIRIGEQA